MCMYVYIYIYKYTYTFDPIRRPYFAFIYFKSQRAT